MAISKLGREIISDIRTTISELGDMRLLRDQTAVSTHTLPGNILNLSFSGKNESSGIMYDKHLSCAHLMDVLLSHRQYTVLLYDKSIIQAEFLIDGNTLIKERLVFMKKHNKNWGVDEIDEYEANDEDWFSEEVGIPILIRIDYDPSNHEECEHASSHLTLSNHESCRIPMKQAVTFSDFVRFILFHFYEVKLRKPEYRLDGPEDITASEKKMIHINWEA